MAAKYYKQLKFYCKHCNITADKKDKIEVQDQLNQKIGPTDINLTLQTVFDENQIQTF